MAKTSTFLCPEKSGGRVGVTDFATCLSLIVCIALIKMYVNYNVHMYKLADSTIILYSILWNSLKSFWFNDYYIFSPLPKNMMDFGKFLTKHVSRCIAVWLVLSFDKDIHIFLKKTENSIIIKWLLIQRVLLTVTYPCFCSFPYIFQAFYSS